MFSKISISTKIIGIVVMVLAISVVVAVLSISRLSKVAAVADNIGEVLMPRVTS